MTSTNRFSLRVISLLAVPLLVLLVGLAAFSLSGRDSVGWPGSLISRPSAASLPAVKISLDTAGLYRVTADALLKAGFDLQADDPSNLRLTVGGRPVPFLVEGEGRDAEITFYGRPRASRYGRTNVYWLRWADEGTARGGPAAPRAVSTGQGQPQEAFEATLSLEKGVHYLSQMPDGDDHWLWQPIYAPATFTVPFSLPGWAGAAGQVKVRLWANTQDPSANPDHHALLRINGQRVADETWDGQGWHVIEASLPAAALKEQDNELLIESPGDTDAVVDVVYLDRVDLSYPRRLEALDDHLYFTAWTGQPVAVSGFQDADILLWDVTDPAAAQPLSGFEVDGNTLRFLDSGQGGLRSYVATTRAARLSPLTVQPPAGRDLRQNPEGADYIAIVAPGFQEALQPLVDYRRGQGLRVTVATIDEVYDTFSEGLPDPAAIRAYMRYARENWRPPAPRFLLLVGDASYDYQGFLANGAPNLVPTYLLTTHFVGETASDNWFVSLTEGDDQPDMAVGRIPAQTAQQVAVVVAKTLAYEQAPRDAEWLGRALFVADNKQPSFQAISDDLASKYLPSSFQVEKVYLGQVEDANQAVVESLRRGVGLVNYVGHGSMNVWAQEKMFKIEDVPLLDNGTALPFLVTMTCLVGYFHHPLATSMGEELLFKENGGVVAALVPTSESLASDQRLLAERIYARLFGGAPTIGEAIMLAKQDLPADRGIMQDLIETFNLLGDPALALHLP